jgi:iron complex outermembrane recepter protein
MLTKMIRALAASTAMALILGASPLAAQDGTASVQEVEGSQNAGEIIVTAQKREERLQDVPIAVSVLGGELIAQQGGINLESAQYLVPTLNFRKSGAAINQSLFLRGVGTSTFSIAGEPSVSTVVDGVVYSRAGEAFSDLVDIERLEVLRGPQGTLFGKNASAGVVNIVTRRPGSDFGGFAEGGVYFDNGTEYRARAALDIPIGPDAATRITGFYSDYDGNIFNEAPNVNRRVNGFERWGVRGVVVADLSPTVTATIIGDYREARDDCCAEVIGGPPRAGDGSVATATLNYIQPGLPLIRDDETREVRQNVVTRSLQKSWGGSLQLDAELGGVTVTSITAYRRYDEREIRDGDFFDRPYIDLISGARFNLQDSSDDGPQTGNTWSQELRLTSPGNQTLEYVVGLYYSRAESERTFARNVSLCDASVRPATLTPCSSAGAPALRTISGTARFGSVFTNAAAFGQGTLNISDRLRFIGGLRFTIDQLDVFHSRVGTPGPGINGNFDAGVYNNGATTVNASGQTVFVAGPSNGVPYRARASAENLSGRAGAQFDISDASTAYATYTRGYKGPAFNTFFNLTATGAAPIAAETSDGYEVGLKNTLFGGTLVLNLAAYYAKYKNFQANNPDIVAGVVVTRFTNAGDVSTRGAELDFIWNPADDVTLSGGVAYTDAHVDQFRLPPGGTASQVVPSGTKLAYAPEWKASLAADWRIRTGGAIDFALGSQASWQTEQLSIFSASAVERAAGTIAGYALVDLSASVVTADDRARLTFQVKNVFDESFAAAIGTGGPGGSFRYIIPREADRYFGVIGRVNF